MQVRLGKIVVLGTGGTIAGLAGDPARSRHYVAAQKPVADLLGAVPVPAGCELLSEQVAQVDSKDIDLAVWQRLLLRCQHWLAQDDVRGLVITHGTDTLEETALLLQSVLAPAKPVVLTCAMRPANAPDADGPRNLADALQVAACIGAQGVIVVCAGQIHAAVEVQKVHTSRLDAFGSGDAGPLGRISPDGVQLGRDWPRSGKAWSAPDVQALAACTAWPRVEVIYSHALAGGAIVDTLLDTEVTRRLGVPPVQGLVVAGTGNGTVHHALRDALQRAAAAGVHVVRASRCAAGVVSSTGEDEFPDAHGLSPAKARVALMLSLLQGQLARRR
jgi:L-asparaginase